MNERRVSRRRPDPWAVVEHHAERAAELGEGGMSVERRLALYASAAPALIGAAPVKAGELGLTRAAAASDWWRVPVPGRTPGTPQWMAWNSAGEILINRPTTTVARMITAGGLSWALGMIGFAKIMGARALLPAIVIGIGVAVLTKQIFPAWSRLGSVADDKRFDGVLDEMVDRYERDVKS